MVPHSYVVRASMTDLKFYHFSGRASPFENFHIHSIRISLYISILIPNFLSYSYPEPKTNLPILRPSFFSSIAGLEIARGFSTTTRSV